MCHQATHRTRGSYYGRGNPERGKVFLLQTAPERAGRHEYARRIAETNGQPAERLIQESMRRTNYENRSNGSSETDEQEQISGTGWFDH